jgi:hypothetical protein
MNTYRFRGVAWLAARLACRASDGLLLYRAHSAGSGRPDLNLNFGSFSAISLSSATASHPAMSLVMDGPFWMI